MTVQSTVNKISYNGNGSTTAFAFPYRVYLSSHLTVILVAADGTETEQSLGSDYTVSILADFSAATVTMATAPASGTRLVILREVPATQLTDLQNYDGTPADAIERVFDLSAMRDAQQDEKFGRTLQLSVASQQSNIVVADLVADQYLRVSEDGTSIIMAAAGEGGGGGDVNAAQNVGGGEGIYRSKSGDTLQFKTLIAGDNVTLTGGADTVTITGSAAIIDGGANASTIAGGVFKEVSGSDLTFNNIVAGANTTITGGGASGGNITIAGGGIADAPDDSDTYGRSGEAWVALGDAALSDAADFATAAQGALADTALQAADVGTMAAEDAADYTATASLGSVAVTSIAAGANITVSGGVGDITITGSAGGGGGSIDTASNLGNDSLGGGVFNSVSGSDLQFNRIIAGSNVTISGGNGDGNITISGSASGGSLVASNNLSDVASVSTSRTNLGLGTIATQNANAVSITGGSATGLTNLSVTNQATLTGGLDSDGIVAIGIGGANPLDNLPYDFNLVNRGLCVKVNDTSNVSATEVHYSAVFATNKSSGQTHASAIGAAGTATGNNVQVWGATIHANAASGTTGVSLVGLEVGIRNFGSAAAANGGVCLLMGPMGFYEIKAHIQLGANRGGSGTPSSKYGIVFNAFDETSVARKFWNNAFIYTEGFSGGAYSPNYGIDLQNCNFGTAAINIEGGTCTYGVRVTGAKTIGFEAGNTSATAAFRAIGGGTAAFQCASSYTTGIDFSGATFGGNILSHANLDIRQSGAFDLKGSGLVVGSAGTHYGYWHVLVNGVGKRVQLLNV